MRGWKSRAARVHRWPKDLLGLWAQSQRAADDYAAMLDPLVAVARRELGHETATDETALWLARTRTGQGPLRAA